MLLFCFQAFIQTLFCTAVICQKFSFFTLCLVQCISKTKKKKNIWRNWVSILSSRLSFYCHLPVVKKCLEKYIHKHNWEKCPVWPYLNFNKLSLRFCLKMFLLQKKLLVNTNFVKTKLRVSAVHAKYQETHISGNNLVPNVFDIVNII